MLNKLYNLNCFFSMEYLLGFGGGGGVVPQTIEVQMKDLHVFSDSSKSKNVATCAILHMLVHEHRQQLGSIRNTTGSQLILIFCAERRELQTEP